MVELVDTRDLKSLGHRLCRFKPGSGYQIISSGYRITSVAASFYQRFFTTPLQHFLVLPSPSFLPLYLPDRRRTLDRANFFFINGLDPSARAAYPTCIRATQHRPTVEFMRHIYPDGTPRFGGHQQ